MCLEVEENIDEMAEDMAKSKRRSGYMLALQIVLNLAFLVIALLWIKYSEFTAIKILWAVLALFLVYMARKAVVDHKKYIESLDKILAAARKSAKIAHDASEPIEIKEIDEALIAELEKTTDAEREAEKATKKIWAKVGDVVGYETGKYLLTLNSDTQKIEIRRSPSVVMKEINDIMDEVRKM